MATALDKNVRELLSLVSPVYAVVGQSDETTVSIKGFASVEVMDRSDDVVPPEEFDLDQFMAAPTLLVNHDYWTDTMGNKVAAGRPEEVYVAKLVRIEGDKENWGVYDVKRKEVRNTYPRNRVPNLKAGTRGLFMVAKVTQPEVKRMVETGELAAFSWRGQTHVHYRVAPDGTTERVFKGIDLWEISLVNVPDQPGSTFIIGKTAAGQPFAMDVPSNSLSVHLVRLDGALFSGTSQVCETLEKYKMKSDSLRQEGDTYFALQSKGVNFDLDNLVTVQIAPGVSVIAGPEKATTRKTTLACEASAPRAKAAVPTSGIASILAPFQSMETRKMSEEKTPDAGDKSEEVKDVNKAAAEALSKQVAVAVAAEMKPVMEGISETLKTVGEGFAQIAEKAATDEAAEKEKAEKEAAEKAAKEAAEKEAAEKAAAEKEAAEKAAAEKEEKEKDADSEDGDGPAEKAGLEEVKKTLASLTDQMVAVAKSVEVLGEVTPLETVRDEKVTAKKDADADPNECLDTLFPFTD